MVAVFVHGVPETAEVWSPLIAELDRDDVVALSLPGFGRSLDFAPTMHRYAEWMAGELAAFDEVDLVTHDWGALLALKVLAPTPANVRSWVVDVGDLGPDHRWHDLARVWQTPGEGEAFMDGVVTSGVEERTELMIATGIPALGASAMAAAWDRRMADAILGLYRSATEVGLEWGPGIDQISGPGLVVESMLDPFRSPELAARLAERTGARTAALPEAGHWWMLEDPAGAAATLTRFWAQVEDEGPEEAGGARGSGDDPAELGAAAAAELDELRTAHGLRPLDER